MDKENDLNSTPLNAATENNNAEDLTLDEILATGPRLIRAALSLPRILRVDEHSERLLAVFAEPTQGCLKRLGENTICFHRPGMDFYLPWIKDFKKIVLVHEASFYGTLTLVDLLHRISKNKKFFRGKLFLLIPRGRQSIGELTEYEIREDEFIPIDVDEIDKLPQLPGSSFDPADLPLTPYAPDYYPRFTDLRSWIAALLKNVLTRLMCDRLFPQLKNGLLTPQMSMMQDKTHVSGFSFEGEAFGDCFTSQKGLFRHCISPRGTPAISRHGDNPFGWDDREPCREWYVANRINELGRNLMPPPNSERPAIIPRAEWEEKRWRFHLDERRPLFPLLLWEGHHAKVLTLECFIPPYNFCELIGAMRNVLAALPTPELFPDIESEQWVDVSNFRDGLGSITLEPLCVGYQSEKRGSLRDFYVELTSPDALDELLFNMDEPCGNTYRCPDGNLKIHPTTPSEQEYVVKFLEKSVKPRVVQVRQILWDGGGYRQFATSELVRYYANSIAESFDGNCECATHYLDTLNWKYADRFPRHSRIIRHR